MSWECGHAGMCTCAPDPGRLRWWVDCVMKTFLSVPSTQEINSLTFSVLLKHILKKKKKNPTNVGKKSGTALSKEGNDLNSL